MRTRTRIGIAFGARLADTATTANKAATMYRVIGTSPTANKAATMYRVIGTSPSVRTFVRSR